MNQYLAKQLSGPYAQGLANTVLAEFTLASGEVQYMHDLSIATAVSGVLSQLGLLVGYPWPIVPAGLGNANIFAFSTIASSVYAPTYSTQHGFGTVGGTTGGKLLSAYAQVNNTIDINLYKTLLPLAAQVKRSGLTLNLVDEIAQVFGYHTISFSAYYDIVVTFTPTLSAINIYILQQLFNVFAIEPQVVIQ